MAKTDETYAAFREGFRHHANDRRHLDDESAGAGTATFERIEARVRHQGLDVTSQKVEEVAYLRYASVYKDFQGTADFRGA